jgi:hypothetical protein
VVLIVSKTELLTEILYDDVDESITRLFSKTEGFWDKNFTPLEGDASRTKEVLLREAFYKKEFVNGRLNPHQ